MNDVLDEAPWPYMTCRRAAHLIGVDTEVITESAKAGRRELRAVRVWNHRHQAVLLVNSEDVVRLAAKVAGHVTR